MQTLISITLVLASLCLFSASVEAEEAKFLYPHDKSVISLPKIRVIGKADENKNITITIENSAGKQSYDVSAEENYFQHETKLEKGKNTLMLFDGSKTSDSIEILSLSDGPSVPYPEGFSPYYLHSDSDLTTKCEHCHPGNTNNIPQYNQVSQQASCITESCHARFDKGKFLHGPFQEGKCVDCHNPHGSENNKFLKHSGSALCFTCHSDGKQMITDGKHVHFPVFKGECTTCHDPHKSDLEYHLKRESISGLCAGCHGETFTSQKFQHEPVESGDCIACHTPHVSEYRGLLTAEKNDLCFHCHKIRKEEFEHAYTHEPVAKDCTLCHDPHGSASANHLRNRKDENGNYIEVEQPMKELCLECHRKLDPDVAEQIENSTVQHEPVVQGKCTVCHTPHSTDYKKQLKAPLSEICYSCHQKMKELITGSIYKHGPVRTNDCAQCHLVHGAEIKYLLRGTFSEKFADTFNIDNFALCFNCHNPDIVLNNKSELTSFRNGNKNLHSLHVNRKKNGRTCRTCHNIHASDQEKHIREKVPFNRRFAIKIEYTKTDTGGGCVVGCHKPRNYDRINPKTNK